MCRLRLVLCCTCRSQRYHSFTIPLSESVCHWSCVCCFRAHLFTVIDSVAFRSNVYFRCLFGPFQQRLKALMETVFLHHLWIGYKATPRLMDRHCSSLGSKSMKMCSWSCCSLSQLSPRPDLNISDVSGQKKTINLLCLAGVLSHQHVSWIGFGSLTIWGCT